MDKSDKLVAFTVFDVRHRTMFFEELHKQIIVLVSAIRWRLNQYLAHGISSCVTYSRFEMLLIEWLAAVGISVFFSVGADLSQKCLLHQIDHTLLGL